MSIALYIGIKIDKCYSVFAVHHLISIILTCIQYTAWIVHKVRFVLCCVSLWLGLIDFTNTPTPTPFTSLPTAATLTNIDKCITLNHCIMAMEQSSTEPYAHFLGYTAGNEARPIREVSYPSIVVIATTINGSLVQMVTADMADVKGIAVSKVSLLIHIQKYWWKKTHVDSYPGITITEVIST